jgi:DNA-binding IclR family transcriptional regulator
MNRHYTLFHSVEQVYSMAQKVSTKNETLSSLQLVARVFAVLQVISATTDGAGVTQIAQQTGLPKSTVSRICATLEQLALVTRLPGKEATGRGFKIGPALVALVAHVPHAETLAVIAQPYLQRLQEAVGETVALTLPEGDNAYVVSQITSQQAIQVRDWTGIRIPMYAQSTGRVFLAERTAEALDRYLAQPLLPYTNKTICDPAQLRLILAQVRTQGYAWVVEEFEEGLTALAAPVRNVAGQVIAAVNVFGPTFRFPAAGRQAEITQWAIACAQQMGMQQRRN